MAGNPNPKELLSGSGRHEVKFNNIETPWDITYGHGEQHPPDGRGDDHFGRRPRNMNQWTKGTDDEPGQGED